MKTAIIVFPGTNCDRDTKLALEYLGYECEFIWHEENDLSCFAEFDLVILPGGFSYGDYVRAGRLAKFSSVIKALQYFVEQKKGFVLGICNGFQILCEIGLLPGTLIANKNLKFICKDVRLDFFKSEIILPVAHKEGCYYIPENQKQILEQSNFELIKYKRDINGSFENIAGVFDNKKNILGLMPHPERAILPNTELQDGKLLFEFIKSRLQCKV